MHEKKFFEISQNMKKIILAALLLSTQLGMADDCLELANYEMNELYDTTGHGCQDGVFNAVSASMIGWGIGLFAGIALLTGLIHSHSTFNPATPADVVTP